MDILPSFSLNSNKKIKLDFNGGDMSSDGGMFLINEFAINLGFVKVINDLFKTPASARKLKHTAPENLRQAVYQIIAGYNNDVCANALRTDPVFSRMLGKDKIASQATFSRFFGGMDESTLKCFDSIDVALRDIVYAIDRPEKVVLDIDTTLLKTYGKQEGSAFNYHYQDYGYHPKLCFDSTTGDLIKAELCSGTEYCGKGSGDFIRPVLEEYKKRGIAASLRADSGFATPELYEACEADDCGYVIRLKENNILHQKVSADEADFNSKIAEKDKYQEYAVRYGEFMYQASSWDRERRVVYKIEKPADMMIVSRYTFVVTNIYDKTPEELVDFYCGRGQMENYIKECKNGFDFSAVSSHAMIVNANRLRVHELAYNLLNWFRRMVMPEKMRKHTIGTIRLNMLRIAAKAVSRARYKIFRLCSSFPYIREFIKTLENIGNLQPQLE